MATPALGVYGELNRSRSIDSIRDSRGDWRIKDRIRTVAAGLILCLHLGVDPPDVHKTSPTARLECWVEPEGSKARDCIARNLQQQYEFWQPRARYRTVMDPTADEVRKLCHALRKTAKDERVLLHYNGHGVPRPTRGGELWLFNKQYTQYIPTPVADVAMWTGTPVVVVIECSGAGNIFSAYRQLAESGADVLLLAACGVEEVLPMAPEMPADIFTACLTTPMEIAIRWHIYRAGSLMPAISLDAAMAIPGRLGDRRTALGELNWILTAITDTIAWTILPRELFKRLFRQDVLVASLYRNYLLALRILKTFRCNAQSWPPIPVSSVVCHELWQAWDQALDTCLAQLQESPTGAYEPSAFFTGQLDAFEQWVCQTSLAAGSAAAPAPTTSPHLPIVLQVLLSQSHRSRALHLLGLFTDLGEWAVLDALHVGVFPYILKLFQSPAPEIRYALLYLWTRILVFDASAAGDLLKEDSFSYLVRIIADPLEETIDLWETRTMAMLCLSIFCRSSAAACDLVVSSALPGLAERLIGFAKGAAPVLSEWALLLLSIFVEHLGRREPSPRGDPAGASCGGGGGATMPSAPAVSPIHPPPAWVRALVLDGEVMGLGAHERCENRIAFIHLLGVILSVQLLGPEEELQVVYRLLELAGDLHPPARLHVAIALSKYVSRNIPRFILAAYDLWQAPRRPAQAVVAPGAGDMVRNPGICTLVWKTCLLLALDPADEVASATQRMVDEIHIDFLLRNSSSPEKALSETSRILFLGEEQLSELRAETLSHGGGSVASGLTTTTTPALLMPSSIPMVGPDLAEAAARAVIEHQRRRRFLMERREADALQAHIKKRYIIDADDTRRWLLLPPEQRRFETPIVSLGGGEARVRKLLFHPLQDLLLVATEHSQVEVWDTSGPLRRSPSYLAAQQSEHAHHHHHHQRHPFKVHAFQALPDASSRIVSLACVDWDPIKLLVASSDSLIRLYENFEEGPALLRAAWSMGPLVAGAPASAQKSLLLEWNQHQRRLFTVAAGVELSVLDAAREQIIKRIAMPEGTRVTALTSDRRESPIITLGFEDGWIRRYDLRQPDR